MTEREAIRLGERYRQIQEGDYACSVIICAYPFGGNCECFNTALSQHMAEHLSKPEHD